MASSFGTLRRHKGKHMVVSPVRRHKKSRWNTLLFRRISLLGSLVLGAFIIFLILSFHTRPRTLPPVKIPSHNAATVATVDLPTQENPLFATKPTWAQNFADPSMTSLDSSYWNVLVGPAENSNKEQQYYNDSSSNLRIENNALRLIATHDAQPKGYQYGSARLETQGKKAFLYGRIDVTAKLPSGAGTWPAVWMLPDNNTYANKSPASNRLRYKNGGEIDIFESVGFEPDIIYGVAHTASDASLHPDGTGSYKSVSVAGSAANFNTYTLLWTPTTVTFAINGTAYYTYTRQNGADYTTWPFDQPFYLIANLAVGGTWGGMDTAHYPGGIDANALPSSLDIRSIYYYPYIGSKAVQ
jgi:beta-glucanase (GH16 family)